MEFNRWYEILSVARDAVENKGCENVSEFKAVLTKHEIEVDDALIDVVWKQAWNEYVEQIKKRIELPVHNLMRYKYIDYVVKGKVITDKEFKDILRKYGLMMIPSEEAD